MSSTSSCSSSSYTSYPTYPQPLISDWNGQLSEEDRSWLEPNRQRLIALQENDNIRFNGDEFESICSTAWTMATLYLNPNTISDIDYVNNETHKRVLSMALHLARGNPVNSSWSLQDRDMAIEMRSKNASSTTEQSRLVNKAFTWTQVGCAFAGLYRREFATIGTIYLETQKLNEGKPISRKSIERTYTREELTPQRCRDLLLLNPEDDAKNFLTGFTLINLDQQIQLSNKNNLTTDAAIAADLIFTLEGNSEAELCENTRRIVEGIEPNLQTVQIATETEKEIRQNFNYDEESYKTKKLTEDVFSAVTTLSAMISTLYTIDQKSKLDQKTIQNQRHQLKEIVHAEAKRLGCALDEQQLAELSSYSSANIAHSLIRSLNTCQASVVCRDRKENYQKYKVGQETIRERFSSGEARASRLEQDLKDNANNVQVAVNQYESRIKKEQKRLKYLGKCVGASQVIGKSFGLFALTPFPQLAPLGVVCELLSLPIQASYDRKLRRINKLLKSYQKVHEVFHQVGNSLLGQAQRNHERQNNFRQQETTVYHAVKDQPKLFNPEDYCKILLDCRDAAKKDLDDLKNKEQKHHEKLVEAEKEKRALNKKEGNGSKEERENTQNEQKINENKINELKFEGEILQESIEDAEKYAEQCEEDYTKALALAPYQTYIDTRIKRYLSGRDEGQEILYQGFQEMVKAIQEQAGPYHDLFKELYDLFELMSNWKWFAKLDCLRLKQSAHLGIQAVEFYTAVQVGYEGLKCLSQMAKSNKKIGFGDVLKFGVNGILKPINTGIKLFMAFKHWIFKTSPEDPTMSLIIKTSQRLEEVLNKNFEELSKQGTQHCILILQNVDSVKMQLHSLSKNLLLMKEEFKKHNQQSDYLHLQTNVDSHKLSLIGKLKLNDSLCFKDFKQLTRLYEENSCNPYHDAFEKPLFPPIWSASQPAWFTSRLNLVCDRNLPVPNLVLFLEATHYFIQFVCEQIKESLENGKTPSNRADKKLRSNIADTALHLLTQLKAIKSLTNSIDIIFNKTKEACDTFTKVYFKELNESHVRRRKSRENFSWSGSKTKRVIPLESKTPKKNGNSDEDECFYMSDLCYRITRVKLQIFEDPITRCATIGPFFLPTSIPLPIFYIKECKKAKKGSSCLTAIYNKTLKDVAEPFASEEHTSYTSYINRWFSGRDRTTGTTTLVKIAKSRFDSAFFYWGLLSASEIAKIPNSSDIQRDYSLKAKQLFEAYEQFLDDSKVDNVFTKKLKELDEGKYCLINPEQGQHELKFPLAFPQKFLEDLEIISINPFYFHKLAKFCLSYEFCLDSDRNCYLLFLNYKKANSETIFFRAEIASVGKALIDCYKKIVCSGTETTKEKKNDLWLSFSRKSTYKIQEANLNEVLLLLMYNSFIDNLGKPKKIDLQTKSSLMIAEMEPYEGFYKLWVQKPGEFISLETQFDQAQTEPKPNATPNLNQTQTESKHDKGLNNAQETKQSSSIDLLPTCEDAISLKFQLLDREESYKQQIDFQSYVEKYRLFTAFCSLTSGKSAKDIKRMTKSTLYWINPDTHHGLGQAHFLEIDKKNSQESDEARREAFKEELKKNTSKHVKLLKKFEVQLGAIEELFKDENKSLEDILHILKPFESENLYNNL